MGLEVSAHELALAEAILARNGFILVNPDVLALVDRILAAPALATTEELQAALYALHSGPEIADGVGRVKGLAALGARTGGGPFPVRNLPRFLHTQISQ